MSSSHQPARRGQQQLDARFSPDGGGVGRFAFSLFFYFVCVYAALYNARWVVPWNKRATNNQVDGWDGGLHHRPRRRQSFSELLLFFFLYSVVDVAPGRPRRADDNLFPILLIFFQKSVRPSVCSRLFFTALGIERAHPHPSLSLPRILTVFHCSHHSSAFAVVKLITLSTIRLESRDFSLLLSHWLLVVCRRIPLLYTVIFYFYFGNLHYLRFFKKIKTFNIFPIRKGNLSRSDRSIPITIKSKNSPIEKKRRREQKTRKSFR